MVHRRCARGGEQHWNGGADHSLLQQWLPHPSHDVHRGQDWLGNECSELWVDRRLHAGLGGCVAGDYLETLLDCLHVCQLLECR